MKVLTFGQNYNFSNVEISDEENNENEDISFFDEENICENDKEKKGKILMKNKNKKFEKNNKNKNNGNKNFLNKNKSKMNVNNTNNISNKEKMIIDLINSKDIKNKAKFKFADFEGFVKKFL